MHFVTRSDGTWTEYTYNFADMRTAILHYNATGGLMLGLQYQFNAAGQVVSRAEWDATGDIAVTSYEHDARGQLYHEHFEPTAADAPTLDYVYTYDGNGNRLSKVVESTYYYDPGNPLVSVQTTTYTYDLADPATHGSMANRLMRTTTVQGSGPPTTQAYTYTAHGNLTGAAGTGFTYDKADRVWRTSGYANPGAEYRYAGGQRRYLLRQKDAPTGAWHDVQWSDYVGNSIYADYTVTEGVPAETRRYLPGLWETDLTTQPAQTFFLHTDLLGSVRLMSDQQGAMITDGDGGGLQHYTAFGEPFLVCSDGTYMQNTYQVPTRYGYAGASGYERLASLGGDYTQTLHLGERFYNPGLGRFLQRDPIGIGGGLNAYAYAGNSPLHRVDPAGMKHWESDPMWPRSPQQIPDIPSPRATQKSLQWIAGGCALIITFYGWPVTSAVIGGTLLLWDVGEYTGLIPPAPDEWPMSPLSFLNEWPEDPFPPESPGNWDKWPISPY